ncbi:MAG: class I SAM-dependent methyltransferase [Chloroflexi bacterium]|nr:class I SAM-dependent methyltransferase [Chloroflexota bacterium]MCL5274252.1 class I SAM-dependent methyltransferase [Chloroflexota bacterium]
MIVWIIGGCIAVALLGLVIYWQLAVAEGAYLGSRVVTLLYDWYAPRYDGVKQYAPELDTVMLAVPIMSHLSRAAPAKPLILDIATGTGRLPQLLLAQRRFHGHIIALDLSARMLAIAQTKLAEHAQAITWARHDAQQLPYDNNSADVVTCLEALEFFPDPQAALDEMIRVLKPGGLLLISNRVGPDAWMMPGRTLPTGAFVARLQHLGLHDVQADQWLVDYDIVRATK